MPTITAPKKDKIRLDKEEAWLEENFELLLPLPQEEKDKQLYTLKQAAKSYTIKNQHETNRRLKFTQNGP